MELPLPLLLIILVHGCGRRLFLSLSCFCWQRVELALQSYSFDMQHVEGGTNLRRHGRPPLQTVASSALLTGPGEESSSTTRKFMDPMVISTIWNFHVDFSRGPCWGKSHGISGMTSTC